MQQKHLTKTMHNTTHYRRLTLFAIMLMMSFGGEKCTTDKDPTDKETSPKKKTEQEGTDEADTANKNNGNTPPGNGKTLNHYKKIVEDKYSFFAEYRIGQGSDDEKKQLILAFATILAVLDDNTTAVDEGLEATSPDMLFKSLKFVCWGSGTYCHYNSNPLLGLGIIAAANEAISIEEEIKRIRAEIRKKSEKVLDNLLEKNDDGTTFIQYREDKTRKKNPRTMVTKLFRMKLDELLLDNKLPKKDADLDLCHVRTLLLWCIENGFSNAEDKKNFVNAYEEDFAGRFVNDGDLEAMGLLVEAGLDLITINYLPIAQTNGHTEMEQFLKDNNKKQMEEKIERIRAKIKKKIKESPR